MKTVKKSFVLALMALLTMTTSCKKKSENGNVEVKLTDDPFPMSFVASANLNITKIEIQNAESGDYVMVFEGSAEYNIAGLNNGQTASVSLQSVPAGTYDKVRITIDGASISLTDGRQFNANISGSLQEESDIIPALRVEGDGNASLLIDVDLAETFEFDTNSMNGIITNISQILGLNDFDLDFRAADLSQTGTVSGTVIDDNGTVYANATVKLESNSDLDGDGDIDDIVTISNGQGEFEFIGVPAGSYILTVETEDDVDLIAPSPIVVSAGSTITINSFVVQ